MIDSNDAPDYNRARNGHNDDDNNCWDERRRTAAAARAAARSIPVAAAVLGPRRQTTGLLNLVDALGKLPLLDQCAAWT